MPSKGRLKNIVRKNGVTRMPNINTPLLNAVKFDEKGLVCAIAQDRQTRRVLMVAWMNAEALQKTVETGFAHYYSRSRQNGGIACHTGRESCFYKVWKDGAWQTVDTVLKDEEAIYGHKHP